MDSLANLTDRPTKSLTHTADQSVIKFGEIDKQCEISGEFIPIEELLAKNEMAEILKECLENNVQSRANQLNSLTLSNKEWKILIDHAAAGDTIDTKNILVAENFGIKRIRRTLCYKTKNK